MRRFSSTTAVTVVAGDGTLHSLPYHNRDGLLSRLPNLGPEVILRIFSWLDPPDLLNIARTSKSFRMLLLLRRQAGSVWTDVLDLASSNGYPPCPDDEDWTLPRWIHFVSGNCRTCFYCDKETEANIIWALRKRICEPCQSSRWHFCPPLHIPFELQDPQLRNFNVDLKSVVPSFTRGGNYHLRYCFREKDLLVYRGYLVKLSQSHPDRTQFIAERAKFDTQMQARTSRIMVHAQICLDGEERWTDYRNTSRKRCIDARFKQVCAFMLDLGDEFFTLDDLKHASFRENDIVGRTEALTYEEWTCFKPYLVQIAKDARQKRLNDT